MVRGWRLVKSRFAAMAFDGEGARLNGGRWNSPGVRVAYASDSVALATLKVLVHLRSNSVLAAYSLAGLKFAEKLIEDLEIAGLPSHWRKYPVPPEIQAVGDAWVTGLRSAVLRVPSVLFPTQRNYLLNPDHPDFAKIIVDAPERFEIDTRLLAQ